MPTYEYRCKGCGADLEVVQAFTDDPLTTCEACGGQLRKVFGSVGISFKGSGFYKTDSRSTSGAKSGGERTSSNGEGSSSDATATGSKDAASKDSGSKDAGSGAKDAGSGAKDAAKGAGGSGCKAPASTSS